MKIEQLLSRNKAWAQAKKRAQADYFAKTAAGQQPSVFWIGCCDSRVIPTEILDLSLGDVFVQTNIANRMDPGDANAMSSLQYAVHVLQVQHIVICGHTQCGGVIAAMNGARGAPAAVRQWLAPVMVLYEANRDKLPEDVAAAQRMMSELNVAQQVEAVAGLELIRNLRKQGKAPAIHGWLFCMEEGVIEVV